MIDTRPQIRFCDLDHPTIVVDYDDGDTYRCEPLFLHVSAWAGVSTGAALDALRARLAAPDRQLPEGMTPEALREVAWAAHAGSTTWEGDRIARRAFEWADALAAELDTGAPPAEPAQCPACGWLRPNVDCVACAPRPASEVPSDDLVERLSAWASGYVPGHPIKRTLLDARDRLNDDLLDRLDVLAAGEGIEARARPSLRALAAEAAAALREDRP